MPAAAGDDAGSERPQTPKPTGTVTEKTYPPGTSFEVLGHATESLTTPQVQQVITLSQSQTGPLPSAREFAAYEAAKPGAADWIMAEASRNADHIRQIEREGMRVAARDALLFRLLPFAVVGLFLLVCTIIAFLNVWVGASGIAITLTTVVVAYLKGFGNTAAEASSPTRAPPKAGPDGV